MCTLFSNETVLIMWKIRHKVKTQGVLKMACAYMREKSTQHSLIMHQECPAIGVVSSSFKVMMVYHEYQQWEGC